MQPFPIQILLMFPRFKLPPNITFCRCTSSLAFPAFTFQSPKCYSLGWVGLGHLARPCKGSTLVPVSVIRQVNHWGLIGWSGKDILTVWRANYSWCSERQPFLWANACVETKLKPWPNGLASQHKFSTCVQLVFLLATHLRQLALTLVELKFVRKSTQVFHHLTNDHPTKVEPSWSQVIRISVKLTTFCDLRADLRIRLASGLTL